MMDAFHGQLPSGETSPAPLIEPYLPEPGSGNGAALVIFPGGGYGFLAEHEGEGYARHFSGLGYACFVVSYRLGSDGHRHPAMLEDALAAVRAVRARAGELGIDPGRIGVIGSSAGGHLAAHAMVGWRWYDGEGVSLRPDFGVLCYPVVAMSGENLSHAGSRRALLGEAPSKDSVHEASPARHVAPDTCPCFIWHTWEDDCVPLENSLLFATALREACVPFELHIYRKGGHGLGLNAGFAWAQDCARWLGDLW